MNINRIITEEINRLITEKVYGGQSDTQAKANDRSIYKNFLKLTKGRRADYDKEKDKKENPNISKADADNIRSKLKQPGINLADVARAVYPHHTDQGGDSQLRKKVEQEKTDSGNTYKFNERELKAISKYLNNLNT